MSNEDGTLKEVEVKEALENLKIIEAGKVDIPIKVIISQFCKSKNFQGGENTEEATNTEKAEPKEVVPQEKNLSPPQKEVFKEGNTPEEGAPLEEENSENKNPTSAAEASKKNKKKKKKAAPATSEDIGKKGEGVEKKEDAKEVLGEIDDNKGENAAEVKLLALLFIPKTSFFCRFFLAKVSIWT